MTAPHEPDRVYAVKPRPGGKARLAVFFALAALVGWLLWWVLP